MHYNEPPYRFLRQIGVAVEHAMDRELTNHVERYHSEPTPLRLPPRPPLKAIPFADREIEPEVLRQMLELLEEEPGTDEYVLASIFNEPVSLIQRELADHDPNYRKFLRARRAG